MKKNFYKRIIAIALCAMIAFPASLAVSAVEADNTATTVISDTAEDKSYYKYFEISDPTPRALDEDVKIEIIDAYLATINTDKEQYTREDITLEYYGYYGELGDFTILVNVRVAGVEYPAVVNYLEFNGGLYVYTPETEMLMYKEKEQKFYSIAELKINDQLTTEEEKKLSGYMDIGWFKTKDDLIYLLRGTSVEGGDPLTNANNLRKVVTFTPYKIRNL